jgi:CRP-like cAMP-binding protein
MDPVAPCSGEEGAAKVLLARIFACSDNVADDILRHARLRSFSPQSLIVRQGDWLSLAFLLLLGRARAFIYSADGQMILLHEFRAGDLFGALCEPEDVRQEADVVAVDQVRALVLQAAELALLAQQHGAIGVALTRMLMQRLRQTTERMYERAALSAVGRVYSELLRQARAAPGLRISPAPVLSELALQVSTTRETASRAVNALERRGIIRRDPEALTVVAPHRLEELII